MYLQGKPSLSWWRFAGGMALALLPIALVIGILLDEGETYSVVAAAWCLVSSVGYAAMRWHAVRKQFKGDAVEAMAAMRQDPFALMRGSRRMSILWVLVTSLTGIVGTIVWALWNKLQ